MKLTLTLILICFAYLGFSQDTSKDSTQISLGFRITNTSQKSETISQTKHSFNLVIGDQTTPLEIEFYDDGSGKQDKSFASILIPRLQLEYTEDINLQFCKSGKCYTFSLMGILFLKNGELSSGANYHLEFYQFKSFSEYEKYTKDNYSWESMGQYSKSNFPKYVTVKWMPYSETWDKTELRYLSE